MSKITEVSVWEPTVYQWDTTSPNKAGPATFDGNGEATDGFANAGVQQLANRTAYLKTHQDTNTTTLTSHIGSGGTSHLTATTTTAGFLSASDKTKLDGIATGAQANVATNLGITTGATTTTVTSSTGTSAVVPAATTSIAGVISAADKIKLDGIAAGAQVNPNTFGTLAVSGQTSVAASVVSDTLTLVAGTNVTITTTPASNSVTINSTASGGGLTNFTDTLNTTSPNTTIPVAVLSTSGSATNIDLAIVPKGTGAILARVPDSAATGGNKRGSNAVDLQTSRTAAAHVASGTTSVVVGGDSNRATGTNSVVVGGTTNSATGTNSFVGSGSSCTATAQGAVSVGGNLCSASGTGSAILGGEGNTANGTNSSIPGGSQATTRTFYGAESRANGYFTTQGDAQRSRVALRAATTTTATTVLTSDQTAASSLNIHRLPDNSTFGFEGTVVARDASGNSSKWRVDGLVVRGSGAATTALVSTPVVTMVAQSGSASTWSVAVSANTTLGGVVFTVTGPASAVKWVADIQTVEVVG